MHGLVNAFRNKILYLLFFEQYLVNFLGIQRKKNTDRWLSLFSTVQRQVEEEDNLLNREHKVLNDESNNEKPRKEEIQDIKKGKTSI